MFFKEISKFPPVEDGKIEFVPFIEASKGIVKFVELLGTLFTPVRQDVQGNINKLSQIHSSDEKKFSTVNDIIEVEIKEGKLGIDALLWLKRALEFVHVFLFSVVEDSKNDSHNESLSSFFQKAYEETLKPFHGMLVQKLFGWMVLAGPSRKSLMILLSNGEDPAPEDEIIEEMDSYIQQLGSNISAINNIFETHNLVFNQKV
ncbi:glycolipid transfer protein [Trichonephila inaurata madagascariensis]|uniref:Glycolipid transfer protein n=1 Tax=Trichonephila inaurata madagascariensis TaxID=2747483 RepID=A0A8X7C486_9ARAC|nr:glycolipid transfer protein [Trichonephila inaurata madagascariensis]